MEITPVKLKTHLAPIKLHTKFMCKVSVLCMILGLHTLKVLYILESRDFSQAEKEGTACKGEQIHNSQKLEDM